MAGKLSGKVAVVAGATRGAGRGIALVLATAGATVYVVGRTTRGGPKPIDGAPGTVEDTAEEVSSRGGQGIAIPTDCTNPEEVASLFGRVQREQGRLDVLACSIFDGVNFMQNWGKPFWEQPVSDWRDGMAGVTSLYLTSRHAAAVMAKQKSGLIVGITDMIMDEKEPRGYCGHMMQDLGHETINRLMFNMSQELKKHKVAVCTLMPGFMRTERVLMHLKSEELKKQFGFERSESTEFLGRAVAALASDPKGALSRTGKISFVADIAQQYGFTDVDGRVVPRFSAKAG
jgi:NAD(P)-dependent dehydrogenase (short-subunit alcohol dehydrogenase family)